MQSKVSGARLVWLLLTRFGPSEESSGGRCIVAVGVAPEIPIYFVFFDIMNCIGHCNFECMPTWAQAGSRRRCRCCCYAVVAIVYVCHVHPLVSLPAQTGPLKYFVYTSSYHSLHHSRELKACVTKRTREDEPLLKWVQIVKLRQVQVQLLPLLSDLGLPWWPSSQLQRLWPWVRPLALEPRHSSSDDRVPAPGGHAWWDMLGCWHCEIRGKGLAPKEPTARRCVPGAWTWPSLHARVPSRGPGNALQTLAVVRI